VAAVVPQVLVLGFAPMVFGLVAEVLWARKPELAWIPGKTIYWQVAMVSLPASEISESESAMKE
jgi:hypothetical protein